MKKISAFTFTILFAFLFLNLKSFAQAPVKPSFKVEGEVLTPLTLTVDDLSKLKSLKLKAKDRDGKEHEFGGVALSDVLQQAGVTLGSQLRGENLSKYILIKAADNYEVIFSLPEVDPEFSSDPVLLAYQVDGNPLPKGEGPFRIVAPGDKKHARWIREISVIKIVYSKE